MADKKPIYTVKPRFKFGPELAQGYAVGIFFGLVPAILAGAATGRLAGFVFFLLLLATPIAALAMLFSVTSHKATRWDFFNDEAVYTYQRLSNKRRVVKYSDIINISASQSMTERAANVGSLYFETKAGMEGFELKRVPAPHRSMEKLRTLIGLSDEPGQRNADMHQGETETEARSLSRG